MVDTLNKAFAALMIFVVLGWCGDAFLRNVARGHDSLGGPLWLDALTKGACLIWVGVCIWRGRPR